MIENPCIQAKIGHSGALEEALQKLRGKETDISEEAADIKVSIIQYLRVKIEHQLSHALLKCLAYYIWPGFHRKASAPATVKDVGPISEGLYSCCHRKYFSYAFMATKEMLMHNFLRYQVSSRSELG